MKVCSFTAKGLAWAVTSAITFGMVPCFSLPLLHAGLPIPTITTYRFSIAVIIIGTILAIQKKLAPVTLPDLFKLMFLGLFYWLTVNCFSNSLRFIASGVADTIQFVYPMIIIIVLRMIYKIKIGWHKKISAIFAFFGVGFLSWEPKIMLPENHGDWRLMAVGVGFALLAALSKAFYFIGIEKAKITYLSGFVFSFYVMFFGTIFCILNAFATDKLIWISSWRELTIAIILAIITAVISNYALVMSIDMIGPTTTSLFSVVEPVTAVFIGIMFFAEPFTQNILYGVILTVSAIIILVTGKYNFWKKFKKR